MTVSERAQTASVSMPSPTGLRVFLVLPAYNEALNLPGLLTRVNDAFHQARFDFQIVVVDDGSVDNTQEVLAEYRSRVPLATFKHAKNQGLGPTIRDCLLEASKLAGDNDVIVSMDADQSHNPGLVKRMVDMIQEGFDVVIASRYQHQARVCGLVWHRHLVSFAASTLFRLLFPTKGVRDYTCGFRAYRGAVLKQAFAKYGDRFVDQQGFQCMVDILLKLREMGWIMGEVPMVLRYDLKEGASKMRIAKTSVATLRLMFRRYFHL